MEPKNDAFDAFRKRKEEFEDFVPESKRKTAYRGYSKKNIPYQNNYRKRRKKEKMHGKFRKMLVYRKGLNEALKRRLEEDWVKELGITSITGMFLYAVKEGFINEGFKND